MIAEAVYNIMLELPENELKRFYKMIEKTGTLYCKQRVQKRLIVAGRRVC